MTLRQRLDAIAHRRDQHVFLFGGVWHLAQWFRFAGKRKDAFFVVFQWKDGEALYSGDWRRAHD